MRRNYSSKSNPRNRGFGLDNLVGYIKELKGKLQVSSNNGRLLHNENTLKIIDVNHFFSGRLIDIELDIKNVPLQEDEIVNEESIF